jgi:type IV secretion system protein VirD4
MRNDELSKTNLFFYAIGLLPVTWAALLSAPYLHGGLPEILNSLSDAINNPLNIVWCEDSLKAILILAFAYLMCLAIWLSTARNYRRREEHGSARWGNAVTICRRYRAVPLMANKLLTQKVRIGLDGRKHRRNLNVMVVGGSGSGKTRFYAKPNIMQANTSFVVLDPKGEILRDTGNLLEEEEYEVRVLDLINMERSHCYNPFTYINSDKDIPVLVTNLFKNTTPKGAQTNDPFWDNSAMMLLEALMFLLWYEAPSEEQNFEMVMELVDAMEVREDDEMFVSPLDVLFQRVEMDDPSHIAVSYYNKVTKGAAKTVKSILISLITRLDKFNLPPLAALTRTDDIALPTMGEKKIALFAVIPDNDSSFNFLVGMLYTQLFQSLMYLADHKYGGRLPVHVHFVMDEFANVALPDDFDKLLSTMRSREISVSIILQNLAQLKALFEKQWESIVGNCDEFLYLGGNEQSTHKYISELLGKETLDTNTYGQSRGHNGSYSINWQQTGRELLTPDEVRMLDNRYALLFIRGEHPIKDEKFDILKHPSIKLTADGDTNPYTHGGAERAVATLRINGEDKLELHAVTPMQDIDQSHYELLCEADIEEHFKEVNES